MDDLFTDNKNCNYQISGPEGALEGDLLYFKFEEIRDSDISIQIG